MPTSATGQKGFTYRGISVAWNEKRKRFQCKVPVGRLPNGKADRRNAYGKDPNTVKAEIRKLQLAADTNTVPEVGHLTVEKFFTRWLDEISPTLRRPLAPLTLNSYRSECRNWIFPVIGKIPLEDLTVQHLDRLYLHMKRAGQAPSHLHHVHAVIRRGLALALQRNLVHRNVAAMRDNPGSPKGAKPTPLTNEEARRLFKVLRRRPTGLRWRIGFSLGPRQGEALGLRWTCVDLDAGEIALDWQIQRHPWQHGCADPVVCAAKYCRRERCTPSWVHGCGRPEGCYVQTYRCPQRMRGTGCPRHRRACPDPCPPGCVRHAARCEQRHGGGLVIARPKQWEDDGEEETYQDVVTLPTQLRRELRRHRAQQLVVKRRLGPLYEDHGLVFCQVDGRPIDPRRDLDDLYEILDLAGLPRSGTHLGRHTAAAILEDEGERSSVQQVLRHRDERSSHGYGRRRGQGAPTRRAAHAITQALFRPAPASAGKRSQRVRRVSG